MSSVEIWRRDGRDTFYIDGRMMVPACRDCEEHLRCGEKGCARASVPRAKPICGSAFASGLDHIAQCDRERGHNGEHRAPLPDVGTVVW